MDLFNDIFNTIDKSVNVLLDKEIRLGITGLSRGGKTALITSLVNTISHFGDEDFVSVVPRFRSYQKHDIVYGGICKSNDLSVAKFPYTSCMDALTSEPPRWPEPTDGISEIRLEIRYRDKRWFSPQDTQKLYLDIWDYPGEWLMDLMLLNLSYEEFSKKIKQYAIQLDGCCSANEWIKAGSLLKGDRPIEEHELSNVVKLYTNWLKKAKEQGFAMIIPGRFVLPGDLAGAPILEFVPWVWNEIRDPSSTSLYTELKERYYAYRKNVVEKFYTNCFSKLDRQIVLVDCLKALFGGKETYADINNSFDVLLENFSYGSSNFLSRLLFPKIDKVLFLATKSDLITTDQYGNMLELLKSMVNQAVKRVKADGALCEYMIISAIKSTLCAELMYGQRKQYVLMHEYDDESGIYPGTVPPIWSYDWGEKFKKEFHLIDTRPPRINTNQAIPNMNIDILLEYILGDKL